jgi:hypothetical protein
MTLFVQIGKVSPKVMVKLRLQWLKKALSGKNPVFVKVKTKTEAEKKIAECLKRHKRLEVFIAQGNAFEKRVVEVEDG